MTGLRGAPATMERKLHDFHRIWLYVDLMVFVALMRHRGGGATMPGDFRQIISYATLLKVVINWNLYSN